MIFLLILGGCGDKKVKIDIPEMPDGVLNLFMESYKEGSSDKISQLVIGGEDLIQQIDDVIARTGYDDASQQKMREGM